MAVVATGIAITLAVAGIMVAAIIAPFAPFAPFAAVVMAVMAATVPTAPVVIPTVAATVTVMVTVGPRLGGWTVPSCSRHLNDFRLETVTVFPVHPSASPRPLPGLRL